MFTFENELYSSFPSHIDQVHEEDSAKVVTKLRAKGNGFTDLYETVKARFIPSRQFKFIRIHSFIYLDAACGQPVRCPIRIIPGSSPIRRAILRNSSIPGLATPYTFPMDRIIYDSFDPPQESDNCSPELPSRISRQCLELSEDVRKNIRIVCKEGLVVLFLPLPLEKGKVFVAYNDKSQYRVEAVYYSQNGEAAEPIDVAKEALCLGPYTKLTRIYERVVRLAEGYAGRTEESNWAEEKVTSQEAKSKQQKVINERDESKRVGDGEVL